MLACPPAHNSADTPPAPNHRPAPDLRVRTVRPSVLDHRFCGDPWIVDRGRGTFALCLGGYPLAWIEGLSADLPSLNRLLQELRRRRPRPRRRPRA